VSTDGFSVRITVAGVTLPVRPIAEIFGCKERIAPGRRGRWKDAAHSPDVHPPAGMKARKRKGFIARAFALQNRKMRQGLGFVQADIRDCALSDGTQSRHHQSRRLRAGLSAQPCPECIDRGVVREPDENGDERELPCPSCVCPF